MSNKFSLDQHDVLKGAITAVCASLVTVLYGLVTAQDFSVFNIDWAHLLDMTIQVSSASFLGYLMKNFFSAPTV